MHSPGTDWEALSSTDGSDDCDLSCQNGGLCLPQVKLLMFVHEFFSQVLGLIILPNRPIPRPTACALRASRAALVPWRPPPVRRPLAFTEQSALTPQIRTQATCATATAPVTPEPFVRRSSTTVPALLVDLVSVFPSLEASSASAHLTVPGLLVQTNPSKLWPLVPCR